MDKKKYNNFALSFLKFINLKRIKKNKIIVFILVFIIFIQGIVIAKFLTKNDERNYTVNIVKINTEKDSIDYSEMKENLRKIDQVVREFNTFLVAKNISNQKITTLHQDSLSKVVYLAKQSNRYSQYLVDLEEKLQNIPLGNPTKGYISSNFGMRKNPIPSKNNIAKEEISQKNSATTDSISKIKPQNQVEMQFHKGIDYAVPYGSDVVSTAAGKVIFAGQKSGYGFCVIIAHGDGLDTLYAHLSSIQVKPNQQVEVGQVIAKSGNSGRSTGPHLHYEVRRNNQPVNPKLFLGI